MTLNFFFASFLFKVAILNVCESMGKWCKKWHANKKILKKARVFSILCLEKLLNRGLTMFRWTFRRITMSFWGWKKGRSWKPSYDIRTFWCSHNFYAIDLNKISIHTLFGSSAYIFLRPSTASISWLYIMRFFPVLSRKWQLAKTSIPNFMFFCSSMKMAI